MKNLGVDRVKKMLKVTELVSSRACFQTPDTQSPQS